MVRHWRSEEHARGANAAPADSPATCGTKVRQAMKHEKSGYRSFVKQPCLCGSRNKLSQAVREMKLEHTVHVIPPNSLPD
jgi:hypothetical protein